MTPQSIGPESSSAELLAFANVLGPQDARWSELIRLQVALKANEGTKEDAKRAKEIIKKHMTELLGPLAEFVVAKSAQFVDGFLHAVRERHAIPPARRPDAPVAFRDVRAARLAKLQASAPVLVEPNVAHIKHAALLGGPCTPLVTSTRKFQWESFDGYIGQSDLPLLSQVDRFPSLEQLRLAPLAGVDGRTILQSPLGRHVQALALEDTPIHVLFDALEADRGATRLAVFDAPEFMVGKGPDYHAEVAFTRSSPDAPWESLQFYLRFFRTLPHQREGGMKWMLQQASDLVGRTTQHIMLCLEGRKIDEPQAGMREQLSKLFARPIELGGSTPFLLTAELS